MDTVGPPVNGSLPGVAFGGFAGVEKLALPFAVRALGIIDAPPGFSVVNYFLNFHSVPFGAFLNHRKRPEGAKVSASGGGEKPRLNHLLSGRYVNFGRKI
jgi:hypothetical protein